MSIKIEEGKYYRTQDGRRVGPAVRVMPERPSGDFIWARWRSRGCTFEIVGVRPEDAFHTELVSEWGETPKLWRDMSDEEKGALLLAHHEGKAIEMASHIPGTSRLAWNECPRPWKPTCNGIYRIKPEPVRDTVEMRSEGSPTNRWCFCTELHLPYDTHRITFDTIDGEPDCDSIKMEKL